MKAGMALRRFPAEMVLPKAPIFDDALSRLDGEVMSLCIHDR